MRFIEYFKGCAINSVFLTGPYTVHEIRCPAEDTDDLNQNSMRKFLCSLILHIFVSHALFAGVSQKEREVLLELYHSTGGSQWRTVWELSAPVSTWYGVGLQNDRVVSLELSGNNLTGNLPEALGGLRQLRKLDLSGNSISGNFPKGIFRLKHLTVLDLRKNNLTGEIPLTVRRPKKLAYLDLSGNALSGRIPKGLGRLKSLQWLSLSDNDLGGPIPKALGKMDSIGHLEMEGNRLTGDLPQVLGNLSNLHTLLLKGNGLSGRIPIGLLTLPTLRRFELKPKGYEHYELVDYGVGRPSKAPSDNVRADAPKSGRSAKIMLEKDSVVRNHY